MRAPELVLLTGALTLEGCASQNPECLPAEASALMYALDTVMPYVDVEEVQGEVLRKVVEGVEDLRARNGEGLYCFPGGDHLGEYDPDQDEVGLNSERFFSNITLIQEFQLSAIESQYAEMCLAVTKGEWLLNEEEEPYSLLYPSPLFSAVEVVAHEVAHGVTGKTHSLNLRNAIKAMHACKKDCQDKGALVEKLQDRDPVYMLAKAYHVAGAASLEKFSKPFADAINRRYFDCFEPLYSNMEDKGDLEALEAVRRTCHEAVFDGAPCGPYAVYVEEAMQLRMADGQVFYH